MGWDSVGLAAIVSTVLLAIREILAKWWPYHAAENAASAKRHATEKREAIDEYKSFCSMLKDQIQRYESALSEARKGIDDLHTMHAKCQEDNAAIEQQVHFLYEHLQRLHTAMVQAKLDPGLLPTMPPRRRPDNTGADLIKSNVHQSESLVKEARQVVSRESITAPPKGGL